MIRMVARSRTDNARPGCPVLPLVFLRCTPFFPMFYGPHGSALTPKLKLNPSSEPTSKVPVGVDDLWEVSLCWPAVYPRG